MRIGAPTAIEDGGLAGFDRKGWILVYMLGRPLLSYRDVRCAAIHSHRLGVLGYRDVRCAAIHGHRRPLEGGNWLERC